MKDSEPLKWYQFRLRSLLALTLVVQLSCIATSLFLTCRRYRIHADSRAAVQLYLANARRLAVSLSPRGVQWIEADNTVKDRHANKARSQGESPLGGAGREKMVD